MPLQVLRFRPGITRDVTPLSAEGTWWDCDKVRFFRGFAQKIGGWVKAFSTLVPGIAYSLRSWATVSPARVLTGVGTSRAFYVFVAGTAYDVTPVRLRALTADAMSATDTGDEVVITVPFHGLGNMGRVRIRNATAFAGLSASMLNGTFDARAVTNSTFRIRVAGAATATATGGGPAIVEILGVECVDLPVLTTGYGSGAYGDGPYGGPSPSGTPLLRLPALWSQDNFGSDLVYCPRGGYIYYWRFNSGGGLASPGETLQTYAAALPPQDPQPDADWIPTSANTVLFDARSEILIAVGVNPSPDERSVDPMFVRWADESDPFDWEPREDNRAGGKRLSSGSELVTALRVRENTVIWSDTTLFSMQFVGGDLQFQITPLYENISILGPNAATTARGIAYWMGDRTFYKYDGGLEEIDCPIKDFIFDALDRDKTSQIISGHNQKYNEVWWHYCDEESLLPNRYAIYNYAERVWTFGELTRTGWETQSLDNPPLAAAATETTDQWGDNTYESHIIRHEIGIDGYNHLTEEVEPFTAYIESADYDISEGHNFALVGKTVPDVTFKGDALDTDGASLMSITLTPREEPGDPYGTAETIEIESDSGSYSPQLDFRVRGRQIKARFESADVEEVFWRLGSTRFDIRMDGRR